MKLTEGQVDSVLVAIQDTLRVLAADRVTVLTVEQVARVAHEANRMFQIHTGDPVVSLPWPHASTEQRAASIAGVDGVLHGRDPEGLHDDWTTRKTAMGWIWGPVKSEELRTHPALVPYPQLPPDRKMRDALYIAVVRSLVHRRLDPATRFELIAAATEAMRT